MGLYLRRGYPQFKDGAEPGSRAPRTICDFDLVAATPASGTQRSPCSKRTRSRHNDHLRQGFAGADFEAAVRELRALLLRPSRADEPHRANPPIGWIRQRIESIVNTLKDQLLLEHHGGRTPAGCSPASPRASSPSAPASASTNDSDSTAANSSPPIHP